MLFPLVRYVVQVFFCGPKRFSTPQVNKLQSPNLGIHRHYRWIISCDSASQLWRKTITMFHHTLVHVTTFTMPVHLRGPYMYFVALFTPHWKMLQH